MIAPFLYQQIHHDILYCACKGAAIAIGRKVRLKRDETRPPKQATPEISLFTLQTSHSISVRLSYCNSCLVRSYTLRVPLFI
jgi:hypothetical protein